MEEIKALKNLTDTKISEEREQIRNIEKTIKLKKMHPSKTQENKQPVSKQQKKQLHG